MNTIPSYMTSRHRHCDESFIEAESAVATKDWPVATIAWQVFSDDFEHHLNQEEQVLFPAFEHATGMTMGPTQVKRGEHVQMRQLVNQMTQSLSQQAQATYLGLSETMMMLMQQHNMKEEQMLYPMTQSNLPDPDEVLTQVKAFK